MASEPVAAVAADATTWLEALLHLVSTMSFKAWMPFVIVVVYYLCSLIWLSANVDEVYDHLFGPAATDNMSGLEAFRLACNVMQTIGFAIEMASVCHTIFRIGSPDTSTATLLDHSTQITTSLKNSTSSARPVTRDENELLDTANKCLEEWIRSDQLKSINHVLDLFITDRALLLLLRRPLQIFHTKKPPKVYLDYAASLSSPRFFSSFGLQPTFTASTSCIDTQYPSTIIILHPSVHSHTVRCTNWILAFRLEQAPSI
ncbi:hypothetical protein B0H65DRAFT_573259 [Neurospora tetraspora]|uniref:Uncharacterized protein n=1 Tax=Neurospora tetraspora TaxID=94610 RepID=A0AAE0JFP4_9PEZI|nr:hypothetical protein B0H65DRAFT_573259 [Neurospora tetraspora]